LKSLPAWGLDLEYCENLLNLSNMTLRDYQDRLQWAIRKAFKDFRRIVAYLPTGGGKTAVALEVILAARAKGMRVAFLCDRAELIGQAFRLFSEAGLSVQIVDAGMKTMLHCDIQLGMIESYYRRCVKGSIPPVDLLVIDECHVGNFFKLMNHRWTTDSNPRILGFTATPISAQSNMPLNKLFQHIIIGATVAELVEAGWLCPAIEYGHNELLEFKIERGDFTIESQREVAKINSLDKRMIAAWIAKAKGRKTLCYNVDQEHNEEVCKLFNENGISAVSIDSKDWDHRTRCIELYKDGLVDVLCNVGIATKGFDDPETDCVIANFATMSLQKWIQVIGRGARIHPGKDNFIIFDMYNNLYRHGGYNQDIDWEYLFRNESRNRGFSVKRSFKLCPTCYKYYEIKFLDKCDMCGCDFKVNPMISPVSSLPESLRKPTEEMNFTELHQYAKAMGKKSGWAFYQHELNKRRRGQPSFFNRFSK
jgi:superfamily II DNA or RNA helicase